MSLVCAVGRDDAGVVLPAEVGHFPIGEVVELGLSASESPDWVAVSAVDEDEDGEMAAGDKIVAVVSLHVESC